MESCFYETIHETDLLHVRFELQDAPAFVFPAHWHEYVEILYLIRGQFSAIVQATEYRLNEGDLIIINSGDLHMTRSNTCTYLLLQISASQMRQYLPDFDTMRFDTIIPCSEQPAPLRALLSEMNEIRQNPSDSYQLLFTSRLYEFLYHLCRSYSHQIPSASLTGSQRDLQRVTHVMNWVKVHYPEPLSLETAADSLALSKEYFCRLFKKYTGQTFLEYLNDVRTMHLYEDLQNSDETITVLMEKNGLIRRESVAQDARLKRIVLTQKARDLHRQIEADILAFESNLARGISEEEQEVFLRVAKKMQENLREDLAKQGISICKGGDCE